MMILQSSSFHRRLLDSLLAASDRLMAIQSLSIITRIDRQSYHLLPVELLQFVPFYHIKTSQTAGRLPFAHANHALRTKMAARTSTNMGQMLESDLITGLDCDMVQHLASR